jgi:hypothetical protein
MAVSKLSREKAEEQERANLGYFAGYYDRKTQDRVFELFGAEHPVWGRRQLSPEELFDWGVALAHLMQQGVEPAEAIRRVRGALDAAKNRL